jgi:hypothetical protein
MTPDNGIKLTEPEVDWDRFDIAASYAIIGRCSTAMITSKGEPTLFPDQVAKFIRRLGGYRGQYGERAFPFIELQTNGIPLWDNKDGSAAVRLRDWKSLGLTTIAVSVVHLDPEVNRQIYLPYRKEYINLPGLIDLLHEQKLSVRLAVVMFDGGMDTTGAVADMIAFAGRHRVEQLSFRPVNAPDDSENDDVAAWARQHFLPPAKLAAITAFVEKTGTAVGKLVHGATIYDVNGQNVCLTNSLTLDPNTEEFRQLIFFPDGSIRWDWRFPGARLP